MTIQSLLLSAWRIIISFLLANSLISDNASYLSNFFQTNFVGLILELYTLHCFLYDEIEVLKFFYKTISIVHFLDNKYKNDCTEIFGVIFWFNITKLLF